MVLGTPLRQQQGVLTGHVLLGERTWEMSLAGVWWVQVPPRALDVRSGLGHSGALGSDCWPLAGLVLGTPSQTLTGECLRPSPESLHPVSMCLPCSVLPPDSCPTLHPRFWAVGEPCRAVPAPPPRVHLTPQRGTALHRRDLIQPPGPWGRGRAEEGATALAAAAPSVCPKQLEKLRPAVGGGGARPAGLGLCVQAAGQGEGFRATVRSGHRGWEARQPPLPRPGPRGLGGASR